MKIDDPTPKTILDHLEDLRWVLIKAAGAFAIAAGLGLVFTKQLLVFLYEPLVLDKQNPTDFLKVLSPTDPLSIQINLSLMGGLIVSLPFILWFVAQFILPALTRREARAILPAFAAGAILFAGGVAFCYFLILPQTIHWFIKYNEYFGFQTSWTASNYIDFTLQMLLAFGVSFEMPLVLLVLILLGIVKSATLANYRRHAFLGIVVLACCVVPATDPFSLGMLVLPMYLLFEATIWIGRALERRKEAAQAWPTGPQ